MNPSPLVPLRNALPLVPLFLCAVLAAPAGSSPAPAQDGGRVIVLGFDGADSRTTARMIEEGALPNLAKLAGQGTFAPLVSTNPAESAAGWAALNTGMNPLKNGVPSFIKRTEEGAIMPTFGHIRQERVPIENFQHSGLLGILVHYGGMGLSFGVALAATVGFLVLFLLLRIAKPVAFGLSVILGGVGGYATQHALKYVPSEVPDIYRSMVSQPGFWDVAAVAGKRAIVLDAALAFGHESVPGARVLGGLGLPDVRAAGNGNWFLYTTDDLEMYHTPDGWVDPKKSGTGTTFRVDERNGRVETEVFGPVNFVERDRLLQEVRRIDEKLRNPKLGWKESGVLRDAREGPVGVLAEMGYDETGDTKYSEDKGQHRVKLPMLIVREGEDLSITIADQTYVVGEGEWSGWYRLPFVLNPLITANAVTRARVISARDPLTVYLQTFDIDPENPPFWQPVSQPPEFSSELASWIGETYETLGWACMTNQLKDKMLPVDVFLEDIEFTMNWRRKLTMAALERDDWDMLFSVFSTTDRTQHMMYRHYDPLHPRHDSEEAAREVPFFGEPTRLGDVIPAIYRQMDSIVGEVMEQLGPNDTLLLCADHGFTSYRRGMEVNNWLIENGYMRLASGLTSTRMGNLLTGVDWSQTRAYSLGLGMLYLNLEGREPDGIVARADATELLREIGEKLLEARDPGPEDEPYDEPRLTVHDYAIMNELYTGPGTWGDRSWPCADLQIGFEEYYRASWGTVSGKIRLRKRDGEIVLGPTYRDNTNNWSGDHASNSPQVVTGIFFSNRPVDLPADGVSVMHLAPTVLDLLGVTPPPEMDLPPLVFR